VAGHDKLHQRLGLTGALQEWQELLGLGRALGDVVDVVSGRLALLVLDSLLPLDVMERHAVKLERVFNMQSDEVFVTRFTCWGGTTH
jgi:hypothetical protein